MSLKKLALLVGNAEYTGNMLKNPVHDANDLSQKLHSLGFRTLVGINTTKEDLKRLLSEFQQELPVTDIGLFFFAGHGMQIKGENYITCIDTSFEDEIAADCSSIPLKQIVNILDKGKHRANIIILDACRDNPFERAWNRGVNQQGLAPVFAPRGTIIAFATSPGETASDGKERNGVYTSSILKHIEEQNLPIEEMFKRVRNTVSVMTNGKQTSWEHTSLMGSFFFNSSIPDEQNIAVYSEDAKADAEFVPIESNEAHNLIKALKSCNWYKQNPAILMIQNSDFTSVDKNTLFVIGRNIYQTACGGSTSGENLIKNLGSFLGGLSDDVSFHILNGILYEIYFDSTSRFRKEPKTDILMKCFPLKKLKIFPKALALFKPNLSRMKIIFFIFQV